MVQAWHGALKCPRHGCTRSRRSSRTRFGTGRNPQHAAVAVTEGLLQHLPPDLVKSVLAHEFGHIKNRDILVSSIAAAVAGAIAAIANIFQFSLLFGGEDEDAGALGWIRLLAAIIVAPLAASLLQLAVSRQREYLADATRAQFPRPRSAARRRTRDARARRASPPGEGQPGDRVALRRQPIGTAGCGVPLRDASAGCRARTPAAGARR